MRVRGRFWTVLTVGLVLAGCSSGSDDAGSTAAAPARGLSEGGAGPAADKGSAVEAKAPDLSVGQRSIVYTGSISVRMKQGQSVDEGAARATAVATGAGGFVGSDKRSTGTDHAEATLELRVPADRFAGVVDQLAAIGAQTEQRSIDTQDVTEQTLDLDARIRTQQARVDSGRTLLAQAKSLNDLVMLEGEVAKREADLASLQTKKQHLADLTALSTITVVLLDAKAAAPSDDPGGFLGGLAGGWHALVASLKVLLTILGVLLPWLIALGAPAYTLWYLLRRRIHPAVPAPALATPTPLTPEAPHHPERPE